MFKFRFGKPLFEVHIYYKSGHKVVLRDVVEFSFDGPKWKP